VAGGEPTSLRDLLVDLATFAALFTVVGRAMVALLGKAKEL